MKTNIALPITHYLYTKDVDSYSWKLDTAKTFTLNSFSYKDTIDFMHVRLYLNSFKLAACKWL